MARRRRSWRRWWRKPEEPAYYDDEGRPRSPKGYLIDKQFGDSDFRRDFTRQPGWDSGDVDWWSRWGMNRFGVYGMNRAGVITEFEDLYDDPRYLWWAGDEVPDYFGPYVDYNAAQYLRSHGVTVRPWALMRQASHSDQRIQYPGYGGSTPEGWGGTFRWRRTPGYRPHRRAR